MMAEGTAPVANVGAVAEPVLEEVLTPEEAGEMVQPVMRLKKHED